MGTRPSNRIPPHRIRRTRCSGLTIVVASLIAIASFEAPTLAQTSENEVKSGPLLFPAYEGMATKLSFEHLRGSAKAKAVKAFEAVSDAGRAQLAKEEDAQGAPFAPGEKVLLDGTESVDVGSHAVTCQWTQIGGVTTVKLENSDQCVASFVAPEVADSLAFELQVTDGEWVVVDTVWVEVALTEKSATSRLNLEGIEEPEAYQTCLDAHKVSINTRDIDTELPRVVQQQTIQLMRADQAVENVCHKLEQRFKMAPAAEHLVQKLNNQMSNLCDVLAKSAGGAPVLVVPEDNRKGVIGVQTVEAGLSEARAGDLVYVLDPEKAPVPDSLDIPTGVRLKIAPAENNQNEETEAHARTRSDLAPIEHVFPPVANAPKSMSTSSNTEVRLWGSQSYSLGGHRLSYRWKQVQGTAVSLSCNDCSSPMFVAPSTKEDRKMVFELVVDNGFFTSEPAYVEVNVQGIPVGVERPLIETDFTTGPEGWAWWGDSSLKAIYPIDGRMKIPAEINRTKLGISRVFKVSELIESGWTHDDPLLFSFEYQSIVETKEDDQAKENEGPKSSIAVYDPSTGEPLLVEDLPEAGATETGSKRYTVNLSSVLQDDKIEAIELVIYRTNNLNTDPRFEDRQTLFVDRTRLLSVDSRNWNPPPLARALVKRPNEKLGLDTYIQVTRDEDGLWYTPPKDFSGNDRFRLWNCDNEQCEPTYVGVYVASTDDDPPRAVCPALPPVIGGTRRVELSAQASFDPEGETISYTWTQTGGRSVVLNDAGVGSDNATAWFSAPKWLADETLTFKLTVHDQKAGNGLFASCTSEVVVTAQDVSEPDFVVDPDDITALVHIQDGIDQAGRAYEETKKKQVVLVKGHHVLPLPDDAGTYRCLLNVPDGVILRGEGAEKTILEASGKGQAVVCVWGSDVTVEGMAIKSTEDDGYGILVPKGKELSRKRRYVWGDTDGWVTFVTYYKPARLLFQHNHISGHRYGIRALGSNRRRTHISYAQDVTVRANVITDNETGIEMRATRNVQVSRNRIVGNDLGFHYYVAKRIRGSLAVHDNDFQNPKNILVERRIPSRRFRKKRYRGKTISLDDSNYIRNNFSGLGKSHTVDAKGPLFGVDPILSNVNERSPVQCWAEAPEGHKVFLVVTQAPSYGHLWVGDKRIKDVPYVLPDVSWNGTSAQPDLWYQPLSHVQDHQDTFRMLALDQATGGFTERTVVPRVRGQKPKEVEKMVTVKTDGDIEKEALIIDAQLVLSDVDHDAHKSPPTYRLATAPNCGEITILSGGLLRYKSTCSTPVDQFTLEADDGQASVRLTIQVSPEGVKSVEDASNPQDALSTEPDHQPTTQTRKLVNVLPDVKVGGYTVRIPSTPGSSSEVVPSGTAIVAADGTGTYLDLESALQEPDAGGAREGATIFLSPGRHAIPGNVLKRSNLRITGTEGSVLVGDISIEGSNLTIENIEVDGSIRMEKHDYQASARVESRTYGNRRSSIYYYRSMTVPYARNVQLRNLVVHGDVVQGRFGVVRELPKNIYYVRRKIAQNRRPFTKPHPVLFIEGLQINGQLILESPEWAWHSGNKVKADGDDTKKNLASLTELEVTEDTPTTIVLLGEPTGTDPLDFYLTELPAYGHFLLDGTLLSRAELSDASGFFEIYPLGNILTYVPPQNLSGQNVDGFSYVVKTRDGRAPSTTNTSSSSVSVNIIPFNDSPIVAEAKSIQMNQIGSAVVMQHEEYDATVVANIVKEIVPGTSVLLDLSSYFHDPEAEDCYSVEVLEHRSEAGARTWAWRSQVLYHAPHTSFENDVVAMQVRDCGVDDISTPFTLTVIPKSEASTLSSAVKMTTPEQTPIVFDVSEAELRFDAQAHALGEGAIVLHEPNLFDLTVDNDGPALFSSLVEALHYTESIDPAYRETHGVTISIAPGIYPLSVDGQSDGADKLEAELPPGVSLVCRDATIQGTLEAVDLWEASVAGCRFDDGGLEVTRHQFTSRHSGRKSRIILRNQNFSGNLWVLNNTFGPNSDLSVNLVKTVERQTIHLPYYEEVIAWYQKGAAPGRGYRSWNNMRSKDKSAAEPALENDSLVVKLMSSPSFGVITKEDGTEVAAGSVLSSTTSLTYTPQPGFLGTDNFLCGRAGSGLSPVAVHVDVTPRYKDFHAPDLKVSTIRNQPVAIDILGRVQAPKGAKLKIIKTDEWKSHFGGDIALTEALPGHLVYTPQADYHREGGVIEPKNFLEDDFDLNTGAWELGRTGSFEAQNGIGTLAARFHKDIAAPVISRHVDLTNRRPGSSLQFEMFVHESKPRIYVEITDADTQRRIQDLEANRQGLSTLDLTEAAKDSRALIVRVRLGKWWHTTWQSSWQSRNRSLLGSTSFDWIRLKGEVLTPYVEESDHFFYTVSDTADRIATGKVFVAVTEGNEARDARLIEEAKAKAAKERETESEGVFSRDDAVLFWDDMSAPLAWSEYSEIVPPENPQSPETQARYSSRYNILWNRGMVTLWSQGFMSQVGIQRTISLDKWPGGSLELRIRGNAQSSGSSTSNLSNLYAQFIDPSNPESEGSEPFPLALGQGKRTMQLPHSTEVSSHIPDGAKEVILRLFIRDLWSKPQYGQSAQINLIGLVLPNGFAATAENDRQTIINRLPSLEDIHGVVGYIDGETVVDVLSLSKASDGEGSELRIASVGGETEKGTRVHIEDATGTIRIVPGDYVGVDSLTYTVEDALEGQVTGTLFFEVKRAEGSRPKAIPQMVQTQVSVNHQIILQGTDADNDTLSYEIRQPENGRVTLENNVATYTPNTFFMGPDTFMFRVGDGTRLSEWAPVTVLVNERLSADTGARSELWHAMLTRWTADALFVNPTEAPMLSLPSAPSIPKAKSFLVYAVEDSEKQVELVGYDADWVKNSDPLAAFDVRFLGDQLENGFHLGMSTEKHPMRYYIVSPPRHGTFESDEDAHDQSFIYRPHKNFAGDDSFVYVAHNHRSTSAPAKITIRVLAENDAPSLKLLSELEGDQASETSAPLNTNVSDQNSSVTEQRFDVSQGTETRTRVERKKSILEHGKPTPTFYEVATFEEVEKVSGLDELDPLTMTKVGYLANPKQDTYPGYDIVGDGALNAPLVLKRSPMGEVQVKRPEGKYTVKVKAQEKTLADGTDRLVGTEYLSIVEQGSNGEKTVAEVSETSDGQVVIARLSDNHKTDSEPHLEVLSFMRSESGVVRAETLKKDAYSLLPDNALPLIARMGDFLYSENHEGRTTRETWDSDADGLDDKMTYSTVSVGTEASQSASRKMVRAYNEATEITGDYLWAENIDGSVDLFEMLSDNGEDVLVGSRYKREDVLAIGASGPVLADDARALARTVHALATGRNGETQISHPLSEVVFHEGQPYLPPRSLTFYEGARAFSVDFTYSLAPAGHLENSKRQIDLTVRLGDAVVAYTIPVYSSQLNLNNLTPVPWTKNAYIHPAHLLSDLSQNHIAPYYRIVDRGTWTQKAYFVDAGSGRWVPAESADEADMVDTTTWSDAKTLEIEGISKPVPSNLHRQQYLLVDAEEEDGGKITGPLVGESFVNQRDASQFLKWWLEPKEHSDLEPEEQTWTQMLKVYGKFDGPEDAGVQPLQEVTDLATLKTLFLRRKKGGSNKNCKSKQPQTTIFEESLGVACDHAPKGYEQKCKDSEPVVQRTSQCVDTMQIHYTKESICRLYQRNPAQNYHHSFTWVVDYYGNSNCQGSGKKICMTEANGANGRNQICFSKSASGLRVEYAEVVADWLPFDMDRDTQYRKIKKIGPSNISGKTLSDVTRAIQEAQESQWIPRGYGNEDSVLATLTTSDGDAPSTEDKASVEEKAAKTNEGLDAIHIYASENDGALIRVLLKKPQTNTLAEAKALILKLFDEPYPAHVERGFRVNLGSGLVLDEVYDVDAAGRDPRLTKLVVHNVSPKLENSYRVTLSQRYPVSADSIFFERAENATRLEIEVYGGQETDGTAKSEKVPLEEVYRNGVLVELKLEGEMTPAERARLEKELRELDAYQSVTISAPDELGSCAYGEPVTLFGWDFVEYCPKGSAVVKVVEVTANNRGKLSNKTKKTYVDLVGRLRRYQRAKVIIIDGSDEGKSWSEKVEKALYGAIQDAGKDTSFEDLDYAGMAFVVRKIRQQTTALEAVLDELSESAQAPYLDDFLVLQEQLSELDAAWNEIRTLVEADPYSLEDEDELSAAVENLKNKVGEMYNMTELTEGLLQDLLKKPELRQLLSLPELEEETDPNHVAQAERADGVTMVFVPDAADPRRGVVQLRDNTGELLGEAEVIVPEPSRFEGARLQDLVHILSIDANTRIGCPSGLWLREEPPLSLIQRLGRLHNKEYLHYEVTRTSVNSRCPNAHVLVAGTEVDGLPGHFTTDFEVPEGNRAYLRGHLHFLETSAVFPTPQDLKNTVSRDEVSSCIYPSEGNYKYCYCVPGTDCAEGQNDLLLWRTTYPSSEWYSDKEKNIWSWSIEAHGEPEGESLAPTGGENLIHFTGDLHPTRAEIVVRGVNTGVPTATLLFERPHLGVKRYKVTISDHPDHGLQKETPLYEGWLNSELKDGETIEITKANNSFWGDDESDNLFAFHFDRDTFVRALSKYGEGALTAKISIKLENLDTNEIYERELWVHFDPNDSVRIEPSVQVVDIGSGSNEVVVTLHNSGSRDIKYEPRLSAPLVPLDQHGSEHARVTELVSGLLDPIVVPARDFRILFLPLNSSLLSRAYFDPRFTVTLIEVEGRSIINPTYTVTLDVDGIANPVLWNGFSDESAQARDRFSASGMLEDGTVGPKGEIDIKAETLIATAPLLNPKPDFLAVWNAVDRDLSSYNALRFDVTALNENSLGKKVHLRLVEESGEAWVSGAVTLAEGFRTVVVGLSSEYFRHDGLEPFEGTLPIEDRTFSRRIRTLSFVFTSPDGPAGNVKFGVRQVMPSSARVEDIQAARDGIVPELPPIEIPEPEVDEEEGQPEPEPVEDDAILYPDPMIQIHPKEVPWADVLAGRISIDGENRTSENVMFKVTTKYDLISPTGQNGNVWFGAGESAEVYFIPNINTLNILEGDEVLEVVYFDSENPPMHGQVFVRIKLGSTGGRAPDENKPQVFFHGFGVVPDCQDECADWKVALPQGQTLTEDIKATPQNEGNGRRLVFKHPRLSEWAAIYKPMDVDLTQFAAISFEVQALRYKSAKAKNAGCVNLRFTEDDQDHWASGRYRISADKKRTIVIPIAELKSDGSDGNSASVGFKTRNFNSIAQIAFGFYPNVLPNQSDNVEFSIDEIVGHPTLPETTTAPDCEPVTETTPPDEGGVVVDGQRSPRESVQHLLEQSTTYGNKITHQVLNQFIAGISWTKGEKDNKGKDIPHWNPGFDRPNRFIQVHDSAAESPERLIAEIVHQITHHKEHQTRFHTLPLMCRSGNIRQCPEKPHGDANRIPMSERQWREFQYNHWMRAEAQAVFNSMVVLHEIYGGNVNLKNILSISQGSTTKAETAFHDYISGRTSKEKVIDALMEVVQYRREPYGAVLGARLNERLLDYWGYGDEGRQGSTNTALGNPEEAWTRMQSRDKYGHYNLTDDARDRDEYWYETVAPADQGKIRHQYDDFKKTLNANGIFESCGTDDIKYTPVPCSGAPARPYQANTFSGYHMETRWNLPVAKGGPNANWLSEDRENVHVDDTGALRLNITQDPESGLWKGAEVILSGEFGYGKYSFTVEADVVNWDKNVVLGMFTWDDTLPGGAPLHNREIDIEIARWAKDAREPIQFAMPPYNPGFIKNYGADETKLKAHNNTITYTFDWRPARIEFRAYYGESATNLVDELWRFEETEFIQEPGNEDVRINLWLYQLPKDTEKRLPREPASKKPVGVTIHKFSFQPAN